ncbi:MAG: glycosyl transferase family protein [Sphingomonas sp.]|uniref:glycosyl transferase family protein n=1 Tax=Sphingomonas sp. TaxID=28214 RepID=UPI000DB327E5|nr:glycosyl transferase family protein [Sphingomonas sp.]PZP20095.1 MAG: glycosyl transferase family protein [Sphingomonas hengshuiensis]
MLTGLVTVLEGVARETMLFAAIGFLIGGIDDLAVDFIYLLRRGWRRAPALRARDATSSAPPAPRLAVFVPAWDEAAVIGPMLTTALARFDYPDYRIYVGAYSNDRATIDAVAAIAAQDARVRLVVNDRPGPTTKADNLNAMWHALSRDEADGVRAQAIVFHDAEDVVHPLELRIFARLIERYAAVQLPVRPLIDRRARLVSGHYADEFAEAHAKQLVVREAVGAAMPLAGVGCAIARSMVEAIATARGGDPFDAISLTEDYELGLSVAAMGGRGVLARVLDAKGEPVAVEAYFPGTLDAAVKQKARWMTGIALAGWDRVGWGRPFDLADHWMRMRDRRALLAVLVLGAAYVALVGWAMLSGVRWLMGAPTVPLLVPGWLLATNAVLLGWRLVVRVAFTGADYGWREAIWAVPRVFVGNLIALLAARRAITRYIAMLRGGALIWEKTAHDFPDLVHVPSP